MAKPLTVPISTPPTKAQICRWSQSLRRAENINAGLFRAGLLLDNITIAYRFASGAGVALAQFPAALEARYLDAVSEFARVRGLMRRVEDRELGLRPTADDFDIVESGGPSLGAAFIPVLVGVTAVLLAGLVGRLVYLEQESTELNNKYNSILKASDAALCADPGSDLCRSWEAEKTASNYTKNETMAEALKGAVRTVGGGLGKGLLIALPLAVLAFGWSKRK